MASQCFKTHNLENTTTFFEQAVATVGHKATKVTTDKESSYPTAVEKVLGRTVIHRTNRYLNNRCEQDHRGVKQRLKPMLGFKSSASAARFCPAFDEVHHYFRPREFLKESVSLAKRWVHFKGQYFRLKYKFLQQKLQWNQTSLLLV